MSTREEPTDRSGVSLTACCLYRSILPGSMGRKKLFWRRGLSWALAIAFNLGAVYGLACPIACVPQSCTKQNGTASMPDMPGMPGSHACCPEHSGGKNHAPCGSVASSCVTHAQCAAVSISAANATPEWQSMPVAAPHSGAFSPISIVSAAYISSSPPGMLSGRVICQKKSFLRI